MTAEPVGNVYFMVACGLIEVDSSWLNFYDGLKLSKQGWKQLNVLIS